MTERMNRLPPHVRSLIARQIGAQSPHGVIVVPAIMEVVRPSCPDTITDRLLEDAIAEEAVSTGLAVYFNHASGASPAESEDTREGA